MKLELQINITQTGDGIQATVSGVNSVHDAADKAKHKLDDLGHGKESFSLLTHGADEFAASLIKTVGIVALAEKGMELFGEAVEFVKEGIGHADFVRDLNLSLQVYTGSVEAATKVTKFFEEEQARTRNTAEELQQTFRNLNPLATTKGFTNDAQAQVTVMLSQLATVSNKALGDLEAGFRRILATGGSGGGVGRNPLLQVLGITAEQLRSMGWDQFLAKMQEVSGRVDQFGQSWESTMRKAKVDLLNSFAEGWNGARGSAVDGMDAITAAVRDPVVRDTLKELGALTAEWAGKLGGVITEIRGIGAELKGVVNSPYFRLWVATVTLGTSEVERGLAGALGALGDAGSAKLKAQQAAEREQSAATILRNAGIIAPQAPFGTPGYSSYTGAYKGMEPQANIQNFGSLQQLEKFVADQVAINHLTAEQMATVSRVLSLRANELQKGGRGINYADVNAAIATATATGIEGAPTGKIGKPGVDRTAEIENQTKQLLAQAQVLDLQNQKLAVQAQLGQEEQALGEKKTGLENVKLDALTQQLLVQHQLHALQIVDLDEQMARTKAAADYWNTISDIGKKQKEEQAKPGGGEVSGATFDAARQAAGERYNKTLDEINAKTAKGQADAEVAQRKLTFEAQAIVQARNEELIKIRALVGAQGEEDAILARQLTNAQAQTQLFGLELALQNQGIGFGATRLSQQADALLKLHEQVTLQQAANDTEIAMQEERTRYTKEQTELAKQMAAVTLAGFAGPAEMIQAIASGSDRLKVAQSGGGVNPAIDQLTLLSAQQRVGSELRVQTVIENGHLKILANIKSEAELRNAKLEEAMRGYADLANFIGGVSHDLISGLFAGGGMKHMLSNLASGYQQLLGGALDATISKYLKSWQQIAQGTIDPSTGQMGHIDPRTGQMVPTTPGQQRGAQVAMGVVGGAAALYSSYEGAHSMTKEQGALSGALQGASAGAAFGIYGAIIGGIVGAIAGYLGGGAGKPSYTVTVSGGVISIKGGGDAKQADVNAAMQSINSVIQQNTTAVHGLFDAFPIAIGQSLAVLKPGDLLKQSGSRWFDTSTFKTFLTQDVPAQMLAAYTPLIQGGLRELGVTQKKIAALFSQAPQNQQDPSAFFKFITDFVTGFVAMKDTVAFLGKTTGEKTAIATGLANPLVADQLEKANQNIAYLGQGFDQLTNTDQVERLKQINAAIAQRYQLELQFLNEVANARKAIEKSYGDTVRGFGMSAASPEDQLILLQSQRAAVAASLNDQYNARTRQMVAGAKTPAEVTAIAQSYAELTTQIYNAAKSLRDSFQSILDSFKSLDQQKIADARAALDPTAHLAEITARASGIAAQFSGMSDADKIANSQTLINLANEYYNVQKQALLALKDAARSVHESITKQIFDIQLDQQKANPQQQIEMLLAQRRTLYTALNTATTADQINAIIQQIQGNVTQVAGLEGNTPEAAARSIQALQEADKAAQLQLAALTAQAKANDDAIQAAITGVTTAVTTTITTLNTLMTNATNDLVTFAGLLQTKLSSFVDAMAASDAALLLTLQPIFDALGNSAGVAGDDFDDAGSKVKDFGDAIGRATDRVNHFDGWPGGGNSTFSGSSMSVQMPTPSFNIDISGDMASFVTMVRLVANEEMNKRDAQMMRFTRGRGAL